MNRFHQRGTGLPEARAAGLAQFLISEAIASYFRTFPGHTQADATDLRNLHYPARAQLESLASA